MSLVCASPNIAFIKYWGKIPSSSDQDRNLATNASLSMTLSRAKTTTRFEFLPQGQHTEIFIGSEPAKAQDVAKVSEHVSRVLAALKMPADCGFRVQSSNNFPQGTGIASSASAFAALTFAVAREALGEKSFEELRKNNLSLLSSLARRGSGSACRSVDGPYMKWDGAYAQQVESKLHLYDTILIFSKEHKKVPSSEGHKSAQSSPLFAERLKKVPARLNAVEEALKTKRLDQLGPILEEEALELHHIAKTGTPSITYLNESSLKFVNALKEIRERNFYFTLDAGPNVHLISEQDVSQDIERLLQKLGLQCEIWKDEQGHGPEYI